MLFHCRFDDNVVRELLVVGIRLQKNAVSSLDVLEVQLYSLFLL